MGFTSEAFGAVACPEAFGARRFKIGLEERFEMGVEDLPTLKAKLKLRPRGTTVQGLTAFTYLYDPISKISISHHQIDEDCSSTGGSFSKSPVSFPFPWRSDGERH